MESRTAKVLTLGVSSIPDTQKQMAAAFRGEPVGVSIDFASVELMWTALAGERWRVLQMMLGEGEMTVGEIARRVERSAEAVSGDVDALILAGVLDRVAGGRVIFPYDAVHVDFWVGKETEAELDAVLTAFEAAAPAMVRSLDNTIAMTQKTISKIEVLGNKEPIPF